MKESAAMSDKGHGNAVNFFTLDAVFKPERAAKNVIRPLASWET